MNQKEIKLSQYDDDETLILDGSHESVATFNFLDNFCKVSGLNLKLNSKRNWILASLHLRRLYLLQIHWRTRSNKQNKQNWPLTPHKTFFVRICQERNHGYQLSNTLRIFGILLSWDYIWLSILSFSTLVFFVCSRQLIMLDTSNV